MDFREILRFFSTKTFFLENICALYSWSFALASSIPVLSLKKVCPRKVGSWPRIFCVLGLELFVLNFNSGTDSTAAVNSTQSIDTALIEATPALPMTNEQWILSLQLISLR